MASRERIEAIKKRRLERDRARKRKIYMLRRCLLAAVAIGIIALIILGIKGCVNSVQEHRAEKAARIAAEEAAKPTPTPAPRINAKGIDETFYENSAFVGNSFIDGMMSYDLVEDADYFSKVGLSVSQAMTDSTDTGDVPVIDELNKDNQYAKIFLMFGENEIGWVGNSFFEQYAELIEKVRQYQPQAKIYVLAITAISKKVSDQNIDNLSIDTIKEYNSKMETMAEQCGAVFADLYAVTAEKDGYLKADAATDGVHFGEDYYIKCLKYIQNFEQVKSSPAPTSAPQS